MQNLTPASAASLWSRSRPYLPYIVTAVLFLAGAYALFRLLGPVNLREVMTQVRATPKSTVALSLLCTLIGYLALVGYDWSALRYIGKRLPLPSVILGGFLGYAFGNTIGLSAVSGGAVRYRVYASLGLNGYDIAAIATFASVAYGLGSTVIGFGALAVHPAALGSLVSISPGVMRALSIAVVATLVVGMAILAFSKAGITLRGLRITAPSPGILAGQLVFTAIDILMAALVLFLLLPASSMGFAPFLAVFAAATMAGVISHVPGGIGVFESVVIAALPAAVPVQHAAAALLLYRMIYFLAPFVLALVLLSLNELRMISGRWQEPRLKAIEPILRAITPLVPTAMAVMVFASGVYMLISSIIPASSEASEQLELLLPIGFVEGGALLSSGVGAVLIVLAHGLMRRLEGAYWLSVLALTASIVFALSHGLDYPRAIVIGLALLILLPCRREFYRSTRLTREALSPQWLLLVTLVLIAGGFVFFFANKSTPYSGQLWWQFAANDSAPRAMRAGLVGALALLLAALIYILRPARLSAALASPADLDRAADIVAGQPNPEGNLVLTGDKSVLFSESGRSFLMYRRQGRSWIALGDPIGDPAEAAQLCWQFHDAANAENAHLVFYEVSADFLPLWVEMGLVMHKMGEEGVVDLARFTLEGSERKRLRASYARAQRDGLTLDLLAPPHSDALLAELGVISEAWLVEKNSMEKQFSVGRFDRAYIGRFEIAVVRHAGRIVAFANVLTTGLRRKATIDLMRHLPDAPPGVMEFLFTDLMLKLRVGGYAEFSLGMSPLAGLETRRGTRWTARLGALVYKHGGHFYNFEGLHNFKDKFDPVWRPKFLVAPPRVPILMIAADASILIAGGVKGVVTR